MDKSSLRELNSEQRKELDSKHTILYPPILLVENAQHGLGQPSALFKFKNTINVLHWAQRAKLDLLKGSRSQHYKIGAKMSTMSVFDEPKVDREEMKKQASDIVRKMDALEEELKKQVSVLYGEHTKFIEFVRDHRNIPDRNLLREFNRVLRESDQNYPLSIIPVRGCGSISIAEVRKLLDNQRDSCEAFF